jgi:glycosyltransferase involved in cell wall biosynthesis
MAAPQSGEGSAAPLVSVVVPARNEEASLAVCLESLLQQVGVDLEVIVVDDSSADGTRAIAEAFPVRVVPSGPLPQGWTGKCNAVATGVRHARGLWLLFTDADTVHRPGSLLRALREAEEHQAALLSYSPAQEVRGFWEKAIMPVVFAELASTYRPAQVNDPASGVAAANGQYLLIRRDVYDGVGGHAAIRSSLLEDVELARLVKRAGHRLRFRTAGEAVSARMYRSFAQMREGWTKNLALLFPHSRCLAAKRSAEFAAVVAGVVMGAAGALRRRPAVALTGMLGAGCVYLQFLRRIRRAHFPADSEVVSLFGLPLFAYLLLRSVRAHERSAVTWKGRTYSPVSAQLSSVAAARPF